MLLLAMLLTHNPLLYMLLYMVTAFRIIFKGVRKYTLTPSSVAIIYFSVFLFFLWVHLSVQVSSIHLEELVERFWGLFFRNVLPSFSPLLSSYMYLHASTSSTGLWDIIILLELFSCAPFRTDCFSMNPVLLYCNLMLLIPLLFIPTLQLMFLF